MKQKHRLEWVQGMFGTWHATTSAALPFDLVIDGVGGEYVAKIHGKALKLPNKPPTQFDTPDDAARALELWLLRRAKALVVLLETEETT